jgi:AhpC/TSA antioxidant enzyme
VARHRHELPGRIVVVTFATPDLLAGLEAELELGLEMLADPDRALYAALGLGRGSATRMWLHPRVWRRYATLVVTGARLRRAQGDTLQLSGDAVIDAEGRLSWIHRSEGPEDRPTLERLRRALVDAGG